MNSVSPKLSGRDGSPKYEWKKLIISSRGEGEHPTPSFLGNTESPYDQIEEVNDLRSSSEVRRGG